MTTVNTSTATNTATSKTDTASASLSQNYEDFLLLLTTQLQNQDPTSPADTNQITQQIASLSQVEQQINTNRNLEQLIAMFGGQQSNQAVSYIGKQIDAEGNTGFLSGGAAAFAYNLPANTKTAEVTIKNSAGQVVFTGNGTTDAGRNQVLWDGTNSTTGDTEPAGKYTFTVTAKDADGKALTATTYTTGVVTSVETQNGTTTLSLGDVSVPLEDVLSVRSPS